MENLAYPDEEAPPAEPYYGGGGGVANYHLEGLIPLILIIIIAAVAGSYLGLWELPVPGLSKNPINALIIGQPSLEVLSVLDQQKELITYGHPRSAESLKLNPDEVLSQYDLVILDQTMAPYKYLPRQLGEGLTNYVNKGGKLMVVMNSGTQRKGDIGIIGWKGAFNSDTVPVECTVSYGGIPACIEPVFINGQIWRSDYDHPIMTGIEVWPAMGSLSFETYKVSSTGNEIAWIQNVNNPEYYPAIVEKRMLLGKSIYFNYNPGLTPGILENTLKYLR